jgi:hypothetical protein
MVLRVLMQFVAARTTKGGNRRNLDMKIWIVHTPASFGLCCESGRRKFLRRTFGQFSCNAPFESHTESVTRVSRSWQLNCYVLPNYYDNE